MSRKFIQRITANYERRFAPLMFAAGFIFDALTLRRVDLLADNLVLIAYLFAAGLSVALLSVPVSAPADASFSIMRRAARLAAGAAPYAAQFAFGGLFSAFVIFYTRSADFASSWLFLAALAVLFVGNELFRKKYEALTFRVSIYFVAIFSYAVLVVPIAAGGMGAGIFLLSGAVSLAAIYGFVRFLAFVAPASVDRSRAALKLSVAGIFALFNVFYFANIIPPAPLSLKESGAYHSVIRAEAGGYLVSYEKAPWYDFFRETSSVYRWRRGEPVYFWSAVFAPTRINADILHRWSYFDEEDNRWRRLEEVRFPVAGGRDGGYRGYSFKTAIEPGLWRVEVMTGRGQVLGREEFAVAEVASPPRLVFGAK